MCFNLDGPFECSQCCSVVQQETGGQGRNTKKRRKTSSGEIVRSQECQKLFLVQRGKNGNASKKQLTVVVVICDFLKLDKEKMLSNSCPNKDCAGNALPCMQDVDVMLVDPSCTGSGLQANPYSTTEASYVPEKKDPTRIKALASFQKRILSHALVAFTPSVVCYSTCSIYIGENEVVVNEILNSAENSELNYRVEKAAPFWKTKSEKEFKDGYLEVGRETGNDKPTTLADQQVVSQPQSDHKSKLSELYDSCFHSNPLYDQCRGFFLAKICRSDKNRAHSTP